MPTASNAFLGALPYICLVKSVYPVISLNPLTPLANLGPANNEPRLTIASDVSSGIPIFVSPPDNLCNTHPNPFKPAPRIDSSITVLLDGMTSLSSIDCFAS